MKIKYARKFFISWILLVMFVIFIIVVRFVDVNNIGSENSLLGLVTINNKIHKFYWN